MEEWQPVWRWGWGTRAHAAKGEGAFSCSTAFRTRSGLLGRKKVKKVERSAIGLPTAFFRMGAELNDLPEVTGAAEWRFREQLKPLPLNQNQWGRPTTAGGKFSTIGDQ
jgi:hypothetical protein